MEEELANAEQRVTAHVRADKERQAAIRLEMKHQQRSQAAAEQRHKEVEKTMEAASIAKSGRVAAIKRVKHARSEQEKAHKNFEDTRHNERMQVEVCKKCVCNVINYEMYMEYGI